MDPDDLLAGYTPDWRAQSDDPLAGYTPDWRDDPNIFQRAAGATGKFIRGAGNLAKGFAAGIPEAAVRIAETPFHLINLLPGDLGKPAIEGLRDIGGEYREAIAPSLEGSKAATVGRVMSNIALEGASYAIGGGAVRGGARVLGLGGGSLARARSLKGVGSALRRLGSRRGGIVSEVAKDAAAVGLPDIAISQDREASTAQGLADLGVPGMEAIAGSRIGRAVTEVGLGVVGDFGIRGIGAGVGRLRGRGRTPEVPEPEVTGSQLLESGPPEPIVTSPPPDYARFARDEATRLRTERGVPEPRLDMPSGPDPARALQRGPVILPQPELAPPAQLAAARREAMMARAERGPVPEPVTMPGGPDPARALGPGPQDLTPLDRGPRGEIVPASPADPRMIRFAETEAARLRAEVSAPIPTIGPEVPRLRTPEPEPTTTATPAAEQPGPGSIGGEVRDPELAGAVDPRLVGALGRTGVGAAAGAAYNEDDRVGGAVLGAALAAGVPRLTRTLRGVKNALIRPPDVGPRAVLEKDAVDRAVSRREIVPDPDIDPDEYLNIDKIARGEESMDARLSDEMRRVVEIEGWDPKGVVTHAQTKEIARSLGLRDDFPRRFAETERPNGAEMLAARNILRRNLAAVQSLYESLSKTGLEGGEKEKLHGVLDFLENENESLVGRLSLGGTDLGRNLNAQKIAAQTDIGPDSVDRWLVRAHRLFNKNRIGAERIRLPRAASAEIAALARDGKSDELATAVANLRPSNMWRLFSGFIKAGFLSAPPTHMLNIASTALSTAAEGIKDVPATAIDAGLHRLLGSAVGFVRTKDFGSVSDQVGAVARGLSEGRKDFVKAIKGTISDADLSKYDVYGELDYREKAGDHIGGALNLYVNGVFRTLHAEDRMLRAVTVQRAMEEQARVIAKAEGRTGDELAARVEQLWKKPTEDMKVATLNDVALRQEMMGEAVEAGKYATFTDRSALARAADLAMKGVETIGGKPLATAVDTQIPFRRTPANVASRVAAYSPLGGGQGLWHLFEAAKGFRKGPAASPEAVKLQKQAVEELGRSMTGATGMWLGYELMKKGLMSLGYPHQQGERGQRLVTGEQPNSVRIGDEWVDVSRFGQLGTALLLGGYTYNEVQNREPTIAGVATGIANVASATGRMVAEQSFLEGAHRIYRDATTAQEEEGGAVGGVLKSAGRNVVRGLLPASSLVNRIQRTRDPISRKREGASDDISVYLGRGSDLPARIDPLGREVQSEPGFVRNFLEPVRRQRDLTGDSRVRQVIADLDVSISSRRQRDDETPEQFEERQTAEGQYLEQQIDGLVQTYPEDIDAYAQENYGDDAEEAARLIRADMKEKIENLISRERGNFTDYYNRLYSQQLQPAVSQ